MWQWLRSLRKRPSGDSPLGGRGESTAVDYLRQRGFKIITRNFRCPLGEIDIIAKDRGTLVFVEVKTRVIDDIAPEEHVNHFKRHQLTKTARYYLSRYKEQPPARFDVVAIVWPEGSEPQIRHMPDAFDATF